MSNYLNDDSLPRGIRNNNPGNIVYSSANNWQGKVPYADNQDSNKHFEQFVEMKYGVRALMRLLIHDINAGKNTAATLISSYAPSFENNTGAYINSVISIIGFGIYEVLDLSEETIVGLCHAIITVENGASFLDYVTDQDFSDALAILGITLKKKTAPHHK